MAAPLKRRAPGRVAVLALVLLVGLAGCSTGEHRSDRRDAATTTVFEPQLICDLIGVPLESMRESKTSFVDLVVGPPGRADDGLRAMIAFGVLARGRQQAGRFEPVLGFLTERSVADSAGHGDSPQVTAGVRANARALDRFVADEGCS
jgi:hypothetical protein